MRLSLAMISQDHAATIGRALDSAAPFCDEMIVVDLGSTDRTREIAAERGALVHESSLSSDFAAARNESFDRCTGDWILWLGADDVVPSGAQAAFHAFKPALADQPATFDVVVAPYYWRVADDGTPAIVLHRERLVRRSAGLRWEGVFDEHIRVPEGFGLTGDLIVERRPNPARLQREAEHAVALLERLHAEGDRSPRVLFNLANHLYDQGRFGEATTVYREYLDEDRDGADRYWALVFLAESLIVLEETEEAGRIALEAIAEDSARAEAYMVLGRLQFAQEEWDAGLALFSAATAATRPRLGLVREADYTWSPWDYMAVCFEKLGQLQNTLTAAQRSLPGNPQPDRVRANMHWIVDRLCEPPQQ